MSADTDCQIDGPFSPGWTPVTRSASASKKTPKAASTPKTRQTSPKSEFCYDDAYSVNGEEVCEIVVRKSKNTSRRQSQHFSTTFKKAKQSFLAPTSCSNIKQRAKVVTPKKVAEPTTVMKAATIPISPHFRTRQNTGNKETKLTSEEIMLQKLEQEKAAEAERAAKAKKLYTMLKSRASRRSSKLYGTAIPSSASKPTPKKERRFVQPRKITTRATTIAVPSTVKKGPGGLTLVEPFKFATTKRAGQVPATPDPVRSMPTAELAQNFMRDPRSHGAPATAAQKLTIGHSPKLRTQKRGQYAASKPKPPTAEEKLQAEMEEIQRHPFKARVLDRRIFDSAGELGVPKVSARPVTEPVEFAFRATQPRVRNASTSVSPTKRSTASFKAKPVPKTTGKMPAPRSKTVFKPTVAMSPKFNGGARASMAPTRRQRAAFAPATSSSTTAAEPLKITEPKEFSFATTGRAAYHSKQMQKQLEAEEAAIAAAREVKAHPMPDYSKMAFQPNPAAHKAAPTEPKPFNLRSSARHADAVCAFQQEVQVLAEQTKHADFHARPVPATLYKPETIAVDANEHVPVKPLRISLESERRAKKRAEFDQVMNAKMAQLEVMQENMASQKAEQEARQMRALRRKSVEEGGLMFKAKPIVTKDLFPTKAVAVQPITTPLSPQLRTCRTRSSMSSIALAASGPLMTSASVDTPAPGLGRPQRRVPKTAPSKPTQTSSIAELQQQAELAAALSVM